jgi:dihydrofolate reductase
MKISQIVAVSSNNAIGKNNALIWKLSSDLQYFKKITSGHHILLGRKNYESIGRALPNRVSLIVTRNQNFEAKDCYTFTDIESSIAFAEKAGEEELFIIGGGQIYDQTLPLCTTIYLTEVHHTFEADCFYQPLNEKEWEEVSRENHEADEKNEYAYSFVVYKRIS